MATENIPLLLKQLRTVLREGDITRLVEKTGYSRQTIHKILKGESITESTKIVRKAAKELLESHHSEEQQLIHKL